MNFFLAAGSIVCALGVIIGAFGAHGLEAQLGEKGIELFKTASFYHMIHGLGIIGVSLLLKDPKWSKASKTGWLFLIGVILFSGSLYVLGLSGIKILGMITPFGGLALILGWIWLSYLAITQKEI